MITIHQRHRRTDRRTDRQTTCDRNTALCTKVHRAVKTDTRHLTGFLGEQYQTICLKTKYYSEDGEQTEYMEDDTSSAPEWSIDSDSEHEL